MASSSASSLVGIYSTITKSIGHRISSCSFIKSPNLGGGGVLADKRKQLTLTLKPNPISRRISLSVRCSSSSALNPELKKTLDKVVTSEKVVLFMKGTKEFPMCGFSNTVVQILKSLNVPFETINILENDSLRQGMKEYSNWPTFPQLYVDGEFFGGCDITLEAYKSGELQEQLEKAMCS